jgi:hypothetical protein
MWFPRSRLASTAALTSSTPPVRLIAHPDISLVLRNTDMSRLAQVRGARAGSAAEAVQEAESEMVGARAVLVHAVDQEAVPFYARYGFRSFPIGNQTLFLTVEEIVSSL